jgi:hypothetical protein
MVRVAKIVVRVLPALSTSVLVPPAANLVSEQGGAALNATASARDPRPRRGNAVWRSRRAASTAGFVLVNLWLVYHLAGIVIAPWSVPPSSRLVQNAWRCVGPYVQIFFLNHGYHYFAPQPGDSTLVAYALEMPDGRRETGRIPNRGIWPRLLYHRHFMLTEFLASADGFQPAVKVELVKAMARELCREHKARRVTLSKVTHRLPSMERIRAGGTLDDNYTEEILGTFSCDGIREDKR